MAGDCVGSSAGSGDGASVTCMDCKRGLFNWEDRSICYPCFKLSLRRLGALALMRDMDSAYSLSDLLRMSDLVPGPAWMGWARASRA
jgi:hypothetical protein